MNAQHTSGPWEARRYAIYAPIPEGGGTIFMVALIRDVPSYSYCTGEKEANARLIAAAPDLLEACEKALDLFPHYPEGSAGEEITSLIKAAITKAYKGS